jgi:hypothetical protein
VRLRCPGFAGEFIWGEASERLEPSGEVVDVDEVAQVRSQLVVGFVEAAFDGGVVDGSVHAFDLPTGPWMLGLCQPMIDVVLGAGLFEGVRPNGFSGVEGALDVWRRRARIAWGGEMGSVVGEERVDLVGDDGDPSAEKVHRGAARHLLVQLDESELRRSVDGDKQVEFALPGSNFSDVDMKSRTDRP